MGALHSLLGLKTRRLGPNTLVNFPASRTSFCWSVFNERQQTSHRSGASAKSRTSTEDAVRQDRIPASPVSCLRCGPRTPAAAGMPIRRLHAGHRPAGLPHQLDASGRPAQRGPAGRGFEWADNDTGYVFGLRLNYDPALDADIVEGGGGRRRLSIATTLSSVRTLLAQRPTMRSLAACHPPESAHKADLQRAIATTYAGQQREDVEVSEAPDASQRLPGRGVQVHASTRSTGASSSCADSSAGPAALLGLLGDARGVPHGIPAGDHGPEGLTPSTIRIAKGLSVNQKRARLASSRAGSSHKQAHPAAEGELQLVLIRPPSRGWQRWAKWQDRWLTHPLPDMVSHRGRLLPDRLRRLRADHVARLYPRAWMPPVLHAAFGDGCRYWSARYPRPARWPESGIPGYSAYSPLTIVRMLDIFACFTTTARPAKGMGETPAMRLPGSPRGWWHWRGLF